MVALSGKNLFDASTQWATRPADERFWTVEEMHQHCLEMKASSREATVKMRSLGIHSEGEELYTVGSTGIRAYFTNHSFGQLSRSVEAPAGYLRSLPANMAAGALNHGIQSKLNGDHRNLLLRTVDDAAYRVSAFTTDKYDRIWDSEITERLVDLQGRGWRVPPARPSDANDPRARKATSADVLSDRDGFLSISVGDMIAPAGLYASDHDMFAFMVNEDQVINAGGSVLKRGFFISNSEVGDRSFRLVRFYYNSVCSNHIIWSVEDVKELRVVHRGVDGSAGDRAFKGMDSTLIEYANQSATDDEAVINRAVETKIGDSKKDVVDAIFGKRILPRKVLEASYDLAEEHPEDGHKGPETVYGMINGITRYSQTLGFADRRSEVDEAAGKLLKMDF